MLPIVDIGLGGIGVSFNGADEGLRRLKRCSFLEIMVADCSFYLDNLPYQLLPEPRNLNMNAAAAFQNHFYGVKFLNLMPSQKIQMKHLIHKHGTGGITPKFISKFNHFFLQALGKKQFGDSCQNIWFHRHAH